MYSACAHTHAHRHLDIKPLSVLARGREGEGGGWGEKKLQHISGIFQLMMCGCGSTGEREPLTVLSLFRSPRAPCCIPVHCAYFGNSCSAPFFLFYCIQFVCCSCTFLSSHADPSLPPAPFQPPCLPFLNHLCPCSFPFLACRSCIVGTASCPFCRTRERGKVREE